MQADQAFMLLFLYISSPSLHFLYPPLDPSEELHAPAGAGVGSRERDQPGGGSRGLQGGPERSGDACAHLHTSHPESPAPLQQ